MIEDGQRFDETADLRCDICSGRTSIATGSCWKSDTRIADGDDQHWLVCEWCLTDPANAMRHYETTHGAQSPATTIKMMAIWSTVFGGGHWCELPLEEHLSAVDQSALG